VLWQVVHGWLETFLEAAAQAYDRGLPRYVYSELQRYVRCGILAWGERPCGGNSAVWGGD